MFVFKKIKSYSWILLFLGIIGISSIIVSSQSSAAPVQGWNAGRIIDDSVFTNNTSMSAQSIQNFLNSKVPTCNTNHARSGSANDPGPPYICLKGYSENGRSAAQIIYDTAQTYRINPQVLIVLLQKEQGLVTDDWPWPIQYRTATGYGCPDTAPCDSQYYGLTNQLNWSGKMFRSILDANPNWYTPYVMGNNFIQYNPQGSCGGTTVNIQNRSTQALYNYTPYQPNQAALDAGYGSAPPCGAYGNRNFFLYFNDWFGTTYGGEIGQYAYRLYNSGRRDHNFTARENERYGIKGLGFVDDGIAFKVSPTQEPGMVPIYRMYNGRLTDYWMIPDGPNRYWAIVYGGYRDEGVAFFAYPANTGTSGSICSQGQAVYQMWHGGVGDHYYTTSDGDRYWGLIYGGYTDDKSANYNNPNQGSSAYCIPY